MNISYNNFIPFRARNKEIRRADDIQRRANNNFNFISSSRIQDYYETTKNYENKIKAKGIYDKLTGVILAARYAAEALNITGNGIGVLYADDLDLSEHTGLGNCMEYAKAAMAALCANGYYNSERVNLRYETKFINKETNEVEYKSEDTLDHSFVITDLNCRKEKDIVVDPWLNFADYKEGALTKFKDIFEDKTKYLEKYHCKLFMIEKLQNGEEYNPEDYKMETEFVFAPREAHATKHEKERLGDYARTIYPGLIINSKA